MAGGSTGLIRQIEEYWIKRLSQAIVKAREARDKEIIALIDERKDKENSIFYDNAVLFLKMDLGLMPVEKES